MIYKNAEIGEKDEQQMSDETILTKNNKDEACTARAVVIREDMAGHMASLKQWLRETQETRLEEMADFFRVRLDGYEEHMEIWREAYRYMAGLIPERCETLLDLGCGTGLEIDEIRKAGSKTEITGIDLSKDMLGKLREKHGDIHTICADYFEYDLGEEKYDIVISFESLHHFKPEKKAGLFQKIYRALKPGGQYIEADYIACCEEEERLLMEVCDTKRLKEKIPDAVFVHFDTPLTAEHEMSLIKSAGFQRAEIVECIEGAAFIVAEKG